MAAMITWTITSVWCSRVAQKFIHKGSSHNLVRGERSTVNPDEMHDGQLFDTVSLSIQVEMAVEAIAYL